MTNQGERVALLVEGNPAYADVIFDALTKDNLAREVVVTRYEAEALDYLFGRGAFMGRDTYVMPCVVLLDLSLPHLNGLEVLRRIRADERTRLVPVVTFSSSEEHQDLDMVYTSGANSYIGDMLESESFVESLESVARYWFVLNEPPPTP